MNEKDYKNKMEEALRHAEDIKQRQELEEIRHSNDKKKDISFSKIIAILLCANFFIVELYSMVVMVIFRDLSALGGLITSVIGLCVTVVSYMRKAKSENCVGGITYETAMYGLTNTVSVSNDVNTDTENTDEVKPVETHVEAEDDGAVG